jgi:hypothetical protein
MNERHVATQVVESLREGIPPQRGVELYSVGHEELIDGIKCRHLERIGEAGRIRFISGSWGAGKTHFFRLLREVAFQSGCLVSSVELNVNEAALNKFERVFDSIVRNIATPDYHRLGLATEAAPFGHVLQESLTYLGTGNRSVVNEVSHDHYSEACKKLMTDPGIDIDFKKIVGKYWETFLPEAPDPVIQEQTREEILQWFSGEGTVGSFRKRFGVNKVVSRQNAKLMLQSLANFVKLAQAKLYDGLTFYRVEEQPRAARLHINAVAVAS